MTPESPSARTIETTIAPMLSVRDGAKAIEFYREAFGAAVLLRETDDTGAVVAHLAVGPARFWLSDESIEFKNFSPKTLGGSTVRLVLTVNDPDSVYARAVAAGATAVCPVRQEHDWRIGRLVDPFGHDWEIGHPVNGTR